jgi:hypothetical protein
LSQSEQLALEFFLLFGFLSRVRSLGSFKSSFFCFFSPFLSYLPYIFSFFGEGLWLILLLLLLLLLFFFLLISWLGCKLFCFGDFDRLLLLLRLILFKCSFLFFKSILFYKLLSLPLSVLPLLLSFVSFINLYLDYTLKFFSDLN